MACDCVSLGDLDWAHTNAITACAEAAAAESVLRAALAEEKDQRRRDKAATVWVPAVQIAGQ